MHEKPKPAIRLIEKVPEDLGESHPRVAGRDVVRETRVDAVADQNQRDFPPFPEGASGVTESLRGVDPAVRSVAKQYA
jgi:hypothetical protein